MKSLSLKSMSVLALALFAGSVMTTTASAATFAQNSDGKIEYQKGTINIEDPDNPSAAAVPSFDFGQQDITAKNKTYKAVTAGTLKVSDLRGTGEGWKVTVTQQAQLATTTGAELTGAVLKLNNATTSNSSNETVAFHAGNLTPGTASLVFDAQVNNGNGTSTLAFADGTTDAQLEVPGSTAKKSEAYTAELVWTLTDSPA
nr:WxL domain-containing protein [Streptococcus lutetiensis]